MKRADKVEVLLRNCRPRKSVNDPVMAGALMALSGTKPNAQRTMEDRLERALDELRENKHYLGGALDALPKDKTVVRYELERLLLDVFEIVKDLQKRKNTAGIKRVRKHGQKILRVMEKLKRSKRGS